MTGLQYDISNIGEVGPDILALLPDIAARAEETEKARRLPADLAAKLAAAGAFNLSKPAALGGLELSPLDFMKIIATVAEADASAGWCVMIAVTSTLGLPICQNGRPAKYSAWTMSLPAAFLRQWARPRTEATIICSAANGNGGRARPIVPGSAAVQ